MAGSWSDLRDSVGERSAFFMPAVFRQAFFFDFFLATQPGIKKMDADRHLYGQWVAWLASWRWDLKPERISGATPLFYFQDLGSLQQ